MQCIGHGGASALAPANSVRGFELAVRHGADLIEFDVRLVRGELVLAHSPVGALLPGRLRLDEALAVLADDAFRDVGFVADLKTPGTEAPVVDGLRAHGLLDRTIVASQCPPLLARVREHDPAARVGISVAGRVSRRLARWRLWRDEVAAAVRDRRFDAVMLQHRLVDAALVERLRDAGAEVHAWTIDCAARARDLLELGVDGVVTNDPRVVAEASGGLLLSAPSSPGPSAAPRR